LNHHSKLDGDARLPRSEDHLKACVEFEGPAKTNEKFGYIAAIEVRTRAYCQTSIVIFLKLRQPFTRDFEGPQIYEILSPDLLHQLIKGTFKDHLVTWVEEYLALRFGKKKSREMKTQIDRRYVIS
jgi:hypothetical protein